MQSFINMLCLNTIYFHRRADSISIEASLARTWLRWIGHVVRMHDSRLPKISLYSEIKGGYRSQDGHYKQYKDQPKKILKTCNININDWEKQV